MKKDSWECPECGRIVFANPKNPVPGYSCEECQEENAREEDEVNEFVVGVKDVDGNLRYFTPETETEIYQLIYWEWEQQK